MLPNLGKTDIYLLDQLMKNRITPDLRILDAGCGWGRNSELLIRNNFQVWGIDRNKEAIAELHQLLPIWNKNYDLSRFSVADLVKIPFRDENFDFIISSAVLHFCENRAHFIQIMKELIRVLSPNGILWFRMTAKHTIEPFAMHLYDDIYELPDDSTRYLLDKEVLEDLMKKHHLQYLDPFKTVNVSNIRTMTTVVLAKKGYFLEVFE
ncbi:MAG: ubiquinone/menaquinone biosynthesis C-methylase UbiE [Saprospiraceae bacterium]|jgi:ubiquinone/menaquinone biosynthesis C-methylase UbiE